MQGEIKKISKIIEIGRGRMLLIRWDAAAFSLLLWYELTF